MSRTSSTYVSPNLAPTSEWAQQTSTGVFRPPPASHLSSPSLAGTSVAAVPDRHFDSKQSYLLPISTAQKARDHGAEANGDASVGFSGGGSTANLNPYSNAHERKDSSHVSPVLGPSTGPNSAVVLTLPPMVPLPASPHDSLPVLMKMIRYAVHTEQDVFLAQKETNRVLGAELEREREQRRATSDQLATVTKSIAVLSEIAKQQKAAIVALDAAKSDSTPSSS